MRLKRTWRGWDLMSDLTHCTVEDIALEMGDAPFGSNLKNSHYTDSGALVVQGKNVQGRSFNWNDKRHVSFEKHESIPRSHCYPGDLIFPKVGTIGKVGILSPCKGYDKYILSTNTMRLKVDPAKANPLFVYYYFTWSKTVSLIHAMNSKSVQPVFNYTTLKKFPLELPNLEFQNEAGRIISELDNKIELNRQTNQTLEHIAQAIFKCWFVDFEPTRAKIIAKEKGANTAIQELAAQAIICGAITLEQLEAITQNLETTLQQAINEKLSQTNQTPINTEQLKTTAALFPNELVESDGVTNSSGTNLHERSEPEGGGSGTSRLIPEGWEVGKLKNIAEFFTDRIATAGLTIENYISTENMLEGKKGITKASSLPAVKTVPSFKPGQILISNIRPYFMKIWLARFEGGRSGDVLGLEAKEAESIEYLYNLLYQDVFFNFMMTTSKGAKMPRGDKDAIMGWPCVLPSLGVKKAYSGTISRFYEIIESNNYENINLEKTRDALLPKLLSGELNVSSD